MKSKGLIELHQMPKEQKKHWDNFLKDQIPMFLIECKEKGSDNVRTVCFDSMDKTTVFHNKMLEICDVYFKRNYREIDLKRIPENGRKKIIPINPMFATWTTKSPLWTLRIFLKTLMNVLFSGKPFRNKKNKLFNLLQSFFSLPPVSHYEASPGDQLIAGKIFFQTRLWDPELEKGDWVAEHNHERIALVETLKSGLGDGFVGGLSYTPYAAREYPQLLSNLTPNSKCKRPEFIRQSKTFPIRVNIRALFDAIPYSLGESFAAGQCVIAQRLKNACAHQPVDGVHYAGYDTPKECLDICKNLLAHPDMLQEFRQNAHAYYTRHVRPDNCMKYCLETAFNRP